MRRTAVGIDLGTTDIIAANVGRKGVEIVQNSVSERRTPALVSFTGRRRLLGDAAAPQVKSNFRNSCRGLKHLIGRALDSPEVDIERFWALAALGQAEDGNVGFQVSYRGEDLCVSTTVCLSMLITAIVTTCKAWTKMEVPDVVLGVPSYFSERSRQACLDALRIAGVQCLCLLHESTAIALTWRFDGPKFDDAAPVTVAFCSAGHSSLLVAIARYEKGAVAILGEAYDRTIAGRDMDRAIIEMFVEALQKGGAPDASAVTKARLKLEEEAAKVKKTLSTTGEAKGSSECVIDEHDLACDVKRDAFEERCAAMVEAVKATVAKALERSAVKAEDLTFVEILGGASRVPFIQRAVREAFDGKHELKTTLNADEAVARGCAWQAAMLSSLVRLDPIPVLQCGNLRVALEWEDSENVEAEGSELVDGRRRLVVFEAAGPEADAEVSLRCKGEFKVSAVYLNVEPAVPGGTWSVQFPDDEMKDVEIHCIVTINGIFIIKKALVCSGREEAAVVEEKPEVPADNKSAEASPAAAEEAGAEPAEPAKEAEAESGKEAAGEVNGASAGEESKGEEGEAQEGEAQEGKAEEGEEAANEAEAKPSEAAEGQGASDEPKDSPADGKAPEPSDEEEGPEGQDEEAKGKFWQFWKWGKKGNGKEGDKAATDGGSLGGLKEKIKVGGKKKSKVKKEKVNFKTLDRVGYSKEELEAACKAEMTFRDTDEAVVKAEICRNDYEKYIFTMRDKISGGDPVMEYASPEEQTSLGEALDEAESWADEHVAEEAPAYADRLKALKKQADDLFASRKAALESIQEKVKAFRSSIAKFKASANSPAYDHIDKEKLASVAEECDSCAQWLSDLEARAKEQKRYEASVFSVTELTVRASSLTRNATKILAEPRPKPPEKEKDKEKDKEKEKEKDKDGKGDESKADADTGAEEEVAKALAASATKSLLARFWKPVLGGLLLLALPIGGVLAGFGEPYGLRSPLAGFSQVDADFQAWREEELDSADGPDLAEDEVDSGAKDGDL